MLVTLNVVFDVQIIYLDNLNLGRFSTKHDRIQRVLDFTYDALKQLGQMDKQQTIEGGGKTYGRAEV